MGGDVCFSPAALALLGAIWLVIQAVVVYLFRGWIGSILASEARAWAQVDEAREERDRALDGWEKTVGLGEQAVKRERRRM